MLSIALARRGLFWIGVVTVLVWAGGCGSIGKLATKRADQEAYRIIHQKQQEAGTDVLTSFTISTPEDTLTSRMLVFADRLNLGDDSFSTPTWQISLEDALAISFAHNRAYLRQKEQLFQSALGLSNTRYDFGVQPSLSADGNITRVDSGHDTGQTDLDITAGYGLQARLSRVIRTGGRLSLGFTHDFVESIMNSGAGDPSASNSVTAGVVQPLLRGFGPLVAYESLRQAERNMIYSVRNFQRYQRGFIIDVARQYFRVLSSRDQLFNAGRNYSDAIDTFQKFELLNRAGEISDIEVDRSRQQVLEAESGLINAQTSYQRQLDEWKDDLGLPLDLSIGPDPRELTRIASQELVRPDINLEEALEFALKKRLDLQTSRDRVEDEGRAVKIALRNFLPKLDFSYNFRSSLTDKDDEFSLDLRNNTQTFSLSLDLPLDWTPRRNTYRNALIGYEQAKRSEEQDRNNVILEVRNAWRQLERLRRNYLIQQESVRLSERRVESAQIRLKANLAIPRDVLDAQEDLLIARNNLTSALIDHTIQKLQFWHAIERLEMDPKGMWYDEQTTSVER